MSEHKTNYNSKNDGCPKTHNILHDIRNMHPLTKEQITIIRKMTAEEKMEIILAYDSIMDNITYIINNM